MKVLGESTHTNTSIQNLRGSTRLVFDSIEGITNAVERMHDLIARHSFADEQQSSDNGRIPCRTASENRVVSALNGAVEDHLEDTANPLAAPMTLMAHGQPLEFDSDVLEVSLPEASPASRVAMQTIPYAAPLALGGLRSEGTMDLRNGDLLDEDWHGRDPDTNRSAPRKVGPLLPHVDCYFAAAALGKNRLDP